MGEFSVTSFYYFHNFSAAEVPTLCDQITKISEQAGLKGLVIVAAEGFNGTVSGAEAGIELFKQQLQALFGADVNFRFKDSRSQIDPFNVLKVRMRPEAVTSGTPNHVPPSVSEDHLSPAEWEKVLASGEDILLIDVRNSYEVELGKFKGATDPLTRNFTQFPAFVDSLQVPKDKKVLMYCTGGIRCEKASLQMRERGFTNVFQLDGGILSYLKEFPQRHFEGECFVFDHRVALDQQLAPTEQYSFCPHCGQPGDQNISCPQCANHARICQRCATKEDLRTCSHNCAYHFRREAGLVQSESANVVSAEGRGL